MGDNAFTHILFLKLLNTNTNEIVNDEKLLDIIKDIITSASQIETLPFNNNNVIEISFNWRLIEWKNPYNYLINSNLVTTSNYEDDKIIDLHTKKLILGIETFIKAKFAPINNGNWKILFNILKPLSAHNFNLSLP